jgi:hypothetical protein
MAGEENYPPAGRDCPIYVLEAVRLDATARFEDPDFL